MDLYHIALFVHLLALVAASAASALVHLADARRSRAATVAETTPWDMLTRGTAPVFPIAVLTLVATGAYMVGGGSWGWGAGWVSAGLTGSVLLLVSGATIGKRSAARKARELKAGAGSAPQHDPVIAALGSGNTGLALGVVFVMAAKTPLGLSLGVLALGAILGAGYGLSRERGEVRAVESSVA